MLGRSQNWLEQCLVIIKEYLYWIEFLHIFFKIFSFVWSSGTTGLGLGEESPGSGWTKY